MVADTKQNELARESERGNELPAAKGKAGAKA